ncbi:MFS transporter [Gynuella sunshinyii]|uniref:Arabinose efflux permease n=1 Tax=Gynuella sunshinyii YC6258 TaxID=1445510 RepID=A0A0C5VCW7_9GAMM|nr:MFS transporter [Gynuella sunshinyii]AJQ92337.1 arabinose efflux permease [Gynuella sunshinyii YC6258]
MNLSRYQLTLAILVGVLVTFLASAIKGSYQVYFVDLTELYGRSRGTFALTGAIFGLTIGLMSPLVGWICDRYGAIQTILSGAVATVLVYFLLGFMQSYFLFLVLYGLIAAYALTAMTFVPLGLLVDRIFEQQHKGLAFAAITNGTAIGFMVLSPLWVWLNGFVSWSIVCLAIGTVFLVIVIPALLLLNRALPDIVATPSEKQLTPGLSLHRQITGTAFLLLAISFAGCGSSMAFIDVHLVPAMQHSLDGSENHRETIASTLSLLGMAELLGALGVGWLLRFLKPGLFLAFLYGIRALSLVLITNTQSPSTFIVFGIIFGLSYMGTVIITSLMCLSIFGAQVKGKIFGFLFTIHQLSVFITVWAGGVIFDLTQSYQWVTLFVAGMCVVSVFAALILQTQQKKEAAIYQQSLNS